MVLATATATATILYVQYSAVHYSGWPCRSMTRGRKKFGRTFYFVRCERVSFSVSRTHREVREGGLTDGVTD